MTKRSDYIKERLAGKTIKSAVISGFGGVNLDFTDGSRFEYAVSDDGYSAYDLYEKREDNGTEVQQEERRWII